jgi:hypothetical protein
MSAGGVRPGIRVAGTRLVDLKARPGPELVRAWGAPHEVAEH